MSFAELRASVTMVWATCSTKAFSSFSLVPRLLKLGVSARALPDSRTAPHRTTRPLKILLMLEAPCGVNRDRPIDRGETFPHGWDDEQGETVTAGVALPGAGAGASPTASATRAAW